MKQSSNKPTKKDTKKTLRNIAIIFAVGLILIFVSIGVEGMDISSRLIVVGIGVDYDKTAQEYIATSEVLSPGSGSDQNTSTSSSFFMSRGKTMSDTIFNLYEQTGLQPSLGQCQLLLLGEDLYTETSIKHVITYFHSLESFIDNAVVLCTKGSAHELMQSKLPIGQSVSFTISGIVHQSGEKVATPKSYLGPFMLKQIQLGNSDILNLVEYVSQESPANQKQTEEPIGSYKITQVIGFKSFEMIKEFTEEETFGYTVLEEDLIGQSYVVKRFEETAHEDSMSTAVITDKQVDIEVEKDEENNFSVKIKAGIGLQSLRRGYWGKEGSFHPILEKNLTDEQVEQAKVQIGEQVGAIVKATKEKNIDLLGILRMFEIKYGKDFRDNYSDLDLSEVEFSIEISAKET